MTQSTTWTVTGESMNPAELTLHEECELLASGLMVRVCDTVEIMVTAEMLGNQRVIAEIRASYRGRQQEAIGCVGTDVGSALRRLARRLRFELVERRATIERDVAAARARGDGATPDGRLEIEALEIHVRMMTGMLALGDPP